MYLNCDYVYPLISYLLLHYDFHISWRGGAKIQCTLGKYLHSHNGLPCIQIPVPDTIFCRSISRILLLKWKKKLSKC